MSISRVSQEALVKRINRALRKKMLFLKKCRRSSRAYSDLGNFYVLDAERNLIVKTHVDVENAARELKVLEEHETLVKD
jgi:hypothetical protein